MRSKKTLEINPDNVIVKELNERVTVDKKDPVVRDLVGLLYETTLLSSGFSLEDPNVFARRIHRMIKTGMSLGVEDEECCEEKQNDDDTEAGDASGGMEDVD